MPSSLLLAYHHDYNFLSAELVLLLSAQNAAQERLDRFKAVKQSAVGRFYK